jgi:hypothetical protein
MTTDDVNDRKNRLRRERRDWARAQGTLSMQDLNTASESASALRRAFPTRTDIPPELIHQGRRSGRYAIGCRTRNSHECHMRYAALRAMGLSPIDASRGSIAEGVFQWSKRKLLAQRAMQKRLDQAAE